MAHGDYNCCAICDSKMEYSYEATTKEDICENCRERTGIAAVRQLKEKLLALDFEKRLKFAEEIGLRKCFYPNEIDELLNPTTSKETE